MQIGGYECTSPFVTAGSGNARWCVAVKDGKQYFLKQFLAPVQPVQTTQTPTELVTKRRMRCAAFERRKLALYDALKRMRSDCVVCVDDFFVHEGHYFAASEFIGAAYQTFETIRAFQPQAVRGLLGMLAGCLRTLHENGVVHADLKPEHIVIASDGETPRIRLIDFDSGFLVQNPPDPQINLEVDPVYLSPEAYRMISGHYIKLTHKLDSFALGILFHQALTGEMPGFDRSKYAYLYACVLDGGRIDLSDKLGRKNKDLIGAMLKKNPASRPGDEEICGLLGLPQ